MQRVNLAISNPLPSLGGYCLASQTYKISFMMLDNHPAFFQIRSIDLDTSKLGLNLSNPVFLFMGCSIAESEIHVFQSLREDY
jgi:hypothetical protein